MFYLSDKISRFRVDAMFIARFMVHLVNYRHKTQVQTNASWCSYYFHPLKIVTAIQVPYLSAYIRVFTHILRDFRLPPRRR